MKLQNFLNSLLPNFGKSRLLSDIDCIRKDLSETTLPPLKNIAQAFGMRKFKNEWVSNTDILFRRGVSFKYKGNFLNAINDAVGNMVTNVDTVESLVNDYYADEVVRDGMTLIRVNILQYLETMTFVLRYTRRLLVIVMTMEVEEFKAEVDKVDPDYTPAELAWITENMSGFITGLGIMAIDKVALDKQFKTIPDIAVNSATVDSTTAVIGTSKMDPFGFGFIGVKANPIYHIRIAMAEYQVEQYKLSKEQKQSLEFKLLRLKQLDDGKENAKLEKQIAYTQERIDKLTYSIKQMEDEYA